MLEFKKEGRMIPLSHRERVLIEDALSFYIWHQKKILSNDILNNNEILKEKLEKIDQLQLKIRYFGSPHNISE